jgi:excinuclease ABC subunit C
LDSIPGLGEQRRKALLRQFGSLRKLAEASAKEIAEVPGIGPRTAEAIIAALNQDATTPTPAPADTAAAAVAPAPATVETADAEVAGSGTDAGAPTEPT